MSDAAEPSVLVERRDSLAVVTLNRPARRNGITGRMMTELYAALSGAAADPAVRVLVLRGAGADFCPGADIGHYASGDDRRGGSEPGWSGVREFDVAVLLHEMPAVTIAAVRGACAGAGLGWACACDLRLADETARFNTAFLDVGVAGDMGLPWALPRLVGAAKARELSLLPGKFDAREAERLGLLSRVVPAAEFEGALDALTGRLTGAAPLALATLKSNYLAAEKMGFADFVALEAERHVRLFQSRDTREAFAAFAEKRTPVFQGR